MEVAHDTVPTDESQLEEWFLAALDRPDMPLHSMMTVIERLYREGKSGQADPWAELMEESLRTQGRANEVLSLLRLRAQLRAADPTFGGVVEKKLTDLYRKDTAAKKYVASVGFSSGVPVVECFRRLDLLMRLLPDVLCLDRTWGFGVVRHVDDFYARVAIDFDRKQGHEMTFAYAAESLQILSDKHLLVRRHRDPEGLKKLVAERPAEIVRLALQSYGPMPIARLQDLLTTTVLAPDGWRGFWDAARKALKDDSRVVVPAKRTDSLQLLQTEARYDVAWFESLKTERTAERIFERLDKLQDHVKAPDLEDACRAAIGDRLAFLIHGFGDREPGILARAVMLAAEWQVDRSLVQVEAQAAGMMDRDRLLACAAALPTRLLDAFLRFLAAHDHEKTVAILISGMPQMSMTVLNESLEFLMESGEEERCSAALRDLTAGRKAGVEVLYWLARRPDKLEQWRLGSVAELPFLILAALEKTYMGDRLRTANQLEALLQQKEWLQTALSAMSPLQRRSLVQRLRDGLGRLPVDCQSLLAKTVMFYPELGSLLEETAGQGGSGRIKGGLTSWRMCRQRQQQLEKLINEEIPQNSRDIGAARSYGDLRENFEYKSAKEQQGILMRRRAEWEEGLKTVHGSDFTGFPTDVAGLGTSVMLSYPDGHTTRYFILGEWDQDETLGIISCSSKLGQTLDGHAPGDQVAVPHETGDLTVTVLEVSGLSDEVRAWVRGEPG